MKHKIISSILTSLLLLVLLAGCRNVAVSNPGQATEIQTQAPTTAIEQSTEMQQSSSAEPLATETIQNTSQPSTEPADEDLLISPIDGMKMVFIPAGEFLMGSEKGIGEDDEEPQHTVKMKAFWIDQTEVTNGMYERCVSAGVCTPPKYSNSYSHPDYYGNPEFTDYPVIYVDWFKATKYCQWANRRLPTEAEWEMAARGTGNSIYPWGDNEPDQTLTNFNYQSSDAVKTGSYPKGASTYGAMDMAGNVAEWVSDWYGPYPLYTDTNPQGPASGKDRIVRGGSWITGPYLIRSAARYWVSAYFVDEDTGFRCAMSK